MSQSSDNVNYAAMHFVLFSHPFVVVVVATALADVKNVTCDFSNSEYACGYAVGGCWVSGYESAGSVQLLKCVAY